MSYDEALAERVRIALLERTGISEKKMFGGVAFLLDGKMICGVAGDELMLRIGEDQQAEAMRKPGVRPMDFTGRPMKGYVFVGAPPRWTQAGIAAWVKKAADFVDSLPAKKPASRRPASAKSLSRRERVRVRE